MSFLGCTFGFACLKISFVATARDKVIMTLKEFAWLNFFFLTTGKHGSVVFLFF